MAKPVRLSASSLGILEECPRCFYQQIVHKIRRPEGPFPGITHGMDQVLKVYVDQFRGALPAQLIGKVNGVLFPDLDKMKKYRNWQSGLQAEVLTAHGAVTLIGALDDLLMGPGIYTPLDFKTKRDRPKTSGIEYYGRQANCYSLLLKRNGLEPSGESILSYWWPEKVEVTGNIHFDTETYTIPADPEKAVELLERAMAVLAGGEPEASEKCQFCAWAQVRVEAAVQSIARPLTLQA